MRSFVAPGCDVRKSRMTWVPSSTKVRPSTRRVMTNSPHLGLAEVQHQVPFRGLVGGSLVVRFLPGVDEQGRSDLVDDEADLGHDVLNQRPGSLRRVVVTEAQPASGLQNPEALGHRLLHQRRPVGGRSCPGLR